ncbi:MAG: hypothetical protein ABIU05_21650 [Nitrospirales bacterium]
MKSLARCKPTYACLSLFAVACLLPSPAAGTSLYQVGDVVVGESYNDFWKQWMKRSFSILVGVEELVFEADTGLGEAHVSPQHTPEENVERLERMLVIAKEWSRIAKHNHADTSKALGCFSNHDDDICEKYGGPNHQNQMGLRFLSGNEGQQASLIIELIDRGNQFKHETIYFDSHQISALLKNLKQMPAAMKKAKQASAKQDLFTIPSKP